MSYLSQTVRIKMRETVLDHAFTAKEEAADKEIIDAGIALYMSVHAEYLPIVEKLPKGFCFSSKHFDVSIGGQSHSIELGERRPVTYRSNSEWYPIDANNPIAIAYLQAINKKEEIQNQRKKMASEVNAILNSVRTFKKLWEVWPEAKPLLEKFENKPTVALLPAIQIDKVNAALGLPPDTTELPWTHRLTGNGTYEIGYFGPNGFVKTDEAPTIEAAIAIVDGHNAA